MNNNAIPSSELIIRPATFNDIQYIQSIAYNTWPPTYGHILPAGQVEYMLEKIYGAKSLIEQFKNHQCFYLATINNTPIGFASFTHEFENTYKLQKLYVLPATQKTGAGKKLLNHIEQAIINSGGEILLLNVNRYNQAKAFYERDGFVVLKEDDIDIGSGYFMNDYIMKKRLTLGPSPRGEGSQALANDEL